MTGSSRQRIVLLMVALALWLVCNTVLAAPLALVFIHKPMPAYPPQMSEAGLCGKVRIGLTVSSAGTVGSVRIIQSSHPGFETEVLAAVAQWRFEPWAVTPLAPEQVDAFNDVIFERPSCTVIH